MCGGIGYRVSATGAGDWFIITNGAACSAISAPDPSGLKQFADRLDLAIVRSLNRSRSFYTVALEQQCTVVNSI